MTPRTRLIAALCAAPLLALAPAAPGTAAAFPETLPLPDASSPEGVASGLGTTLYAGSRNTGSISVLDARTGESRYLVAPQAPVAGVTRVVGLNFDQASKLLWVAGGTTGRVLAHDGRTGALVASYAVPGTGRFLNDVAVDRGTVYVTDSRSDQLVVIRDGQVGLLTLTGDYVQPAGFGANGIRVLPGGDLVLVSGGVLYVVDPETGVADRLEQTGGEPLVSGDGLELRGTTLYVVNGFDASGDRTSPLNRDSIAVVDLDLARGTFSTTGELVDDDLERPTTAAFAGGALYAVNGKFDTAGATRFELVRVRP